MQIATFAGGCFWCMVKPFDTEEGIQSVISGYMGGHIENPTYEQVKTGETGHIEVVQIIFDESIFSYERLLGVFWQQIDPTDEFGQFHDKGTQYISAIFYHNDEQQSTAEQSKTELAQSGRFTKPIVTKILPAKVFYAAEDYHQDYYKKSKQHYTEDRKRSGRDEFIEAFWKKD